MAHYIISDSPGYITFVDSRGHDREPNIPKGSLVIHRRTDESNAIEYVHLYFEHGDWPGFKGHLKLTYSDVTAPVVGSNAALITLLKSYAGDDSTTIQNKTIAKWGSILIDDTATHVINFFAFMANEDAEINYIDEDGNERLDLTDATVNQGIPFYSGLNGATCFTAIRLKSGSVVIYPLEGFDTYTTSTTTTTSSTTT